MKMHERTKEQFEKFNKINLEGPGYIGYVHIGYVLRCSDTANTVIMMDGKQRMLVCSEAEELMTPTTPCVQLNYERISQQINGHINPDKMPN